jgi:hypothetical protein
MLRFIKKVFSKCLRRNLLTAPSYLETDPFIMEYTTIQDGHSIRDINVSKYLDLIENDLYERSN